MDARLGDGVVWQEDTDFGSGTIELDIRGANQRGRSFVGIAFRGADDATYDGIYFRPFNFRAEGPGRDRAVQYTSHPDHPWNRLRAATRSERRLLSAGTPPAPMSQTTDPAAANKNAVGPDLRRRHARCRRGLRSPSTGAGWRGRRRGRSG